MPLTELQLDDRTYDQLVDEARRRIAQYAPEWTDLNDSDPGVALVKLFAYMTELLVYRINQVPDRNYVKLLRLLGLDQAPARPAVADVTFTAEAGGPVSVPHGWQLEAESANGGDPVTFETENDLAAAGLPLAQVLVGSVGAQPTLVTALNVAGGPPIQVLGLDPIVGNALYLGFGPADATTPYPFGAELRLRFWLPEPDRERVVAPLRTAPAVPPAGLVWEFLPAAGEAWRPISLIRDETVGFTREGYVLLEPPPALAVASPLPGSPDLCLWLRCRMTSGAYPRGKPPAIDFVRPNTVPAVSLTTVVRELLAPVSGGDAVSSGEADQVFRLRERPVAPGSLELVVEIEGDPEPPEPWAHVEDLLGSRPDDKVYELSEETGQVRFGDGRNGRIPPAGARIVATRYRYGGGAGANVPAGAVSGPAPPRVSEVRNERPAFGGADEQPIEDLKREAPERLRHRQRAVTQNDYAELAREVTGVAAATAIPFAHPLFPNLRVPGAITVVILPEGELLDGSPPRLVPGLVDAVGRYLEDRRTVGTELWIAEPTYVELTVQTLVEAEPSRSMDTVAHDVEQALEKAFDPRQAAFGRDRSLTAVYPVILGVDGVRGVRNLKVAVDGTERELTATIAVPPDGLVMGRNHHVRAVPGEDL